jgi:nitronate monooxygenase
MWPGTRLTERLGTRIAIVQAPMASISTAPMVAAVSEAGGLGSLGSAVMTAGEIDAEIAEIRRRTSRPFAINFFVHPAPTADPHVLERMRQRLAPFFRQVGADLPTPAAPPPPFDQAMLERVLSWRPPVVSFHFGLPGAEAMAALRAAGIRILASATTIKEARILEEQEIDGIIAQGVEAGGHRGTFASEYGEGQIGTMALVRQVVAAVRQTPVIAAGGIADGSGVAAALMLGADGVQLGTAFLGCPEARIDPLYRRTLFEPRAALTRLTTLWTGRPARAIVTQLMEALAEEEGCTPAFPLQRTLTMPLGKAASAAGNPEFLAMWAGQAAPLTRHLPAAELLATLVKETEEARQASAG